ncbi:MAG: 1-acyl-sn-glycerol-3-phosphate acyltransferase [Oscillospiraceae bacterium]|nr:1-acyl-sn-glycerol-3-phosphate acyltransferase [Oscillospiraceae bacterium]
MPLVVILSAISAGIFSALTITEISQIWIIPVSFAAGVVGFSLLYWFALWLTCFFIPVKPDEFRYDKPSKLHLFQLNMAYWFVITAARIKVHASGLEKIPESGRFLFVSNHLSRFDNMVECVTLWKKPLAFISKPSNFKIPIGRHLMTRCCYVSIDRESPKNAMRSINRAADLIKSDAVSVGVFPEGHRGRSYDLQEFKAGCFKAASKSGCPIVVATICGTEKVHKRFPFRRTHVYFDILEVIEAKEKTAELSPKIREIMQNNLDRFKERNND